jgi:hypothetical protein
VLHRAPCLAITGTLSGDTSNLLAPQHYKDIDIKLCERLLLSLLLLYFPKLKKKLLLFKYTYISKYYTCIAELIKAPIPTELFRFLSENAGIVIPKLNVVLVQL